MTAIISIDERGSIVNAWFLQNPLSVFVHISQLSNSFVKNPSDVVAVGDIVTVKVIGIDQEKQKVSLSMKEV